MPRARPSIKCFLEKFVIDWDGCWEWTAGKTTKGYGGFQGGRHAHRVAYEWFVGPLGELFSCHHCDNPACVRPSHLFPGTNSDNIQDSWSKGRNRLQRYPETLARGEAHANAKLSGQDVMEIRERYKSEDISQRKLGKEYGVSQGVIGRIVRNRGWKHVSEHEDSPNSRVIQQEGALHPEISQGRI